jgi:hypothetical protein
MRTWGGVLVRRVDMGAWELGGVRKVVRFFTRWVGGLLDSFSYAQNPQAFAHRLTVVVRA